MNAAILRLSNRARIRLINVRLENESPGVQTEQFHHPKDPKLQRFLRTPRVIGKLTLCGFNTDQFGMTGNREFIPTRIQPWSDADRVRGLVS